MQRRALTAYAGGDFTRAQALFRRVLHARPEMPGIRHNLALTCIALGEYDEAEQLLQIELERYGDYYPRLKVLADLYYIAGRRQEAHDFYRRARDCDAPESESAMLARRLELTADDRGYQRVVQAHEAFAEGNRLMHEEQWDAAIQQFLRAAELDETNIHAINNAGTIYLNNKHDPQEAAALFRRALQWSQLPWLARNLAQAEQAGQARSS